ncbi:integrase, catalytic region, zinc finger, CCHC-type containing protein [Tanacetum coccineum]
MDSMIPIGQKNTLAEYMILSGADNDPSMFDKYLTKKYAELSATKKIQADCDLKETNIILQGLPLVSKRSWERSTLKQGTFIDKSMFEQLNTQVTHCTNVNKALTTELDRYKGEVKDLKEMQNVENSFSGSNEQYAEIVRLKKTLFEQVQEKDSLMKTVSDLKNVLKMEENRNIDREIALEKKIKQLDNIIFKRGQSAQTVHMMTKSKICYDHSMKQAIGFEKPFYLKKVRESKPKLYDGNVILKMDTVVIPDSDETLMLCEESRSKMLLKEQDPLVVKHRVNTKPINYAILNNDYNKRFVRQSDLYSEQAYWKATSVPALDPSHSSTTIEVEVPKELPKVSMVYTSLKELKRYLTGFDLVVKERTTATAITEGTWGFEHTKACFRDEIIPFIKELKDIFNNFNQYLVEELADVQKVFYQMEQAVEQHRLESRTFEVKINQVLSENERLLAQAIDNDIVKTVVNLSVNEGCETVNECQRCLELKTELLNKKDFVDKETYDKLCKSFTTLEKHCITLEADSQLNQENFSTDNRVRLSASASGSQPSGNTRNDKILQTPSSNSKNKNSKKHDNSDYVCINGDDCMSSDNLCVSNSMNDVKFRAKPKKRKSKKEIWKPTGKVFTKIGYIWRPTVLESESPKPVVNLVYSRKPRKNKNTESVSKTKVIKPISANKQEPSKSWGSTKTNVPSTSLNECRQKFQRNPTNPNLGHQSRKTRIFAYGSVVANSCPSVNGKKYILIIVDDYSQFTWVKCLRSKDEAPAFIINFLKMIQVRIKETVCRIRTDNGTEFVIKKLREYYKKVGISHETSVARSPQQNGVVKRRNRTLIEAARTMLIYVKAPLFLWVEAVATTCYIQNRSMIRRQHGKTPYKLLHNKPLDLSYLYVFAALCYPTNDSENLGKLQPKADIGIFIGYAPTKKAF